MIPTKYLMTTLIHVGRRQTCCPFRIQGNGLRLFQREKIRLGIIVMERLSQVPGGLPKHQIILLLRLLLLRISSSNQIGNRRMNSIAAAAAAAAAAVTAVTAVAVGVVVQV
jgi:hypothetical protein